MSINIILATDLNFGIGNENKLPWPRNKKDMDWFRKCTIGHAVVMGRKTWESIGSKPLKHRFNFVVTSTQIQRAHTRHGDMGVILRNIDEDRFPGSPPHDVFVMGGAEIYGQAVPYADKLYLTTFNQEYECDTYVQDDIVSHFPNVEYLDDSDPEITFQIRTKK